MREERRRLPGPDEPGRRDEGRREEGERDEVEEDRGQEGLVVGEDDAGPDPVLHDALGDLEVVDQEVEE